MTSIEEDNKIEQAPSEPEPEIRLHPYTVRWRNKAGDLVEKQYYKKYYVRRTKEQSSKPAVREYHYSYRQSAKAKLRAQIQKLDKQYITEVQNFVDNLVPCC
jgi:hypothetical protein